MKKIECLFLASILAFLFSNCQNQTASTENKTTQTETAPETPAAPTGPVDTLIGFKGAERAGFTVLGSGRTEFQYQNHKVVVSDLQDSTTTGHNIVVTINGQDIYMLPAIKNGFFGGLYHDRLFVDAGTGPNGREITLFNLKTKKPVLRTPYVGEPEILANGKMWYLRPAEQKDITKMPDCPERAEWEKNGLRVGYGQVCVYDLSNDSEIKKSEWRCVALQ